MNQSQFFQNPDFIEYVQFLGRLHRLIREQRDESDEGEALRDEMDRPGEALSEDEVRAVKAISADLASINGHVMRGVGSTKPHPALQNAVDAITRGDALSALAILREHADELPPDVLADLRGRAFAAVDLSEIAADFFEHAKRSAHDNPACSK